jgi:hypothetical protein
MSVLFTPLRGGWIYFLEKAPATKTRLARQPDVVRSEFGVRGLF